jgi:KNOX1 domain
MAYYNNLYSEELTNQEPELLRTIGTGIGDGEKLKAELMSHPLFEQLLAAHVACMRVATPVDQLATLDTQLAESPRVVAKYSNVASAGTVRGDGKELDHFMVN